MNHEPETLLDRAMAARREETESGLERERLDAVFSRVRGRTRRRTPRPVLWGALTASLAGAGAAAFALYVGIGAAPDEQNEWQLLLQSGDVEVRSAGGGPSPGVAATLGHLEKMTTVRLGPEAAIELSVPGAALVRARGPAELQLASASRLALRRGVASFVIAPRRSAVPFVTATRDAEVVVIGTRFSVAVDEQGRLQEVHTSEGVVEVRVNGAEPVRVRASERYPTSTSGGGRAREPEWALSLNPPSAASPAQPAPLRNAPTDADGSKGEANATAAKTQETANAAALRAAQAALEAGRCDELEVIGRALIDASAGTTDKARVAMLKAECLLRTGERGAAELAFKEIADQYQDTPVAEPALFEAAKLLADRGATAEALEVFRRYQERYPKGTLAEAAHFRQCELLVRLDEREQAGDCLARYEQLYPDGPRLGDACLLEATLARLEKRLTDAARLYAQALTRLKDPALREATQYQLVLVIARQASPSLAEAAAAYEREFPEGKHLAEVQRLAAAGAH